MVTTYVTWGDREDLYMETAFSILTLLPDPDITTICVVTERPEFFSFLKDRIEIIPISPQMLVEWAGPQNFSYRRKIKGIQRVIETYPGEDVLFIDGDTFRGKPLGAIRQHLAIGNVCMQESSGLLHKARDRNNRTIWAQLNGKTFAGYTVDKSTIRMNSGTAGLPAKDAAVIIANVLTICDEIYSLTGYYGTEELAICFGLALHGPVMDVGSFLGHYWGNKQPWDYMLRQFFTTQLLRAATLEEMVEAAARVDFTALPVYIHKPRRHRQLERIANRYWPLTRARHYPEKLKEWV